MGRGRVPPPGSVPEPGETLGYSGLVVEGAPAASLPAPEATPWTHGGPPAEYLPTDDDAREAWA
ncbi:MAG: hypothetical protein IRZ08_16025 [Frankia sp.]|nr:hypothetical protein [Frankia sp.]